MSGLMKSERDEYQALIQRHVAEVGVTKCPRHAAATGNIRFNFATRKQREKEEAEKARRMQEVRNG